MRDREKLIKVVWDLDTMRAVGVDLSKCVDYLISNGVTVQDNNTVVRTIPLDEIYRVIAGHSNYHGDDILSALTCIAEGKDVKTVRPLAPTEDVVDQKWIPVSERLPSFEDAVQPTIYDDPAVLAVFKFDDRPRIWCIDVIRRNPKKFTHWMPLPELPKECE